LVISCCAADAYRANSYTPDFTVAAITTVPVPEDTYEY
jgi:hypothetical protein